MSTRSPYHLTLHDNMAYKAQKYLGDFVQCDDEQEKAAAIADIKERLQPYAWHSLKELSMNHQGLLVFPKDANSYVDDIEDAFLYRLTYGNHIETGNLMGAFGVGGIDVDIGSRFDANADVSVEWNGSRHYFMHYLLQKVHGLHVVDLPTGAGADPLDEFCIFLFPVVLEGALSKGLFKNYRRFDYNDANVKGAIDVARYLRTNVPFHGCIAYTTREHTADNPVLQLVRHAIEFIKAGPYREILTKASREIRDCVAQVIAATPSYVRQHRLKVMSQNLRPVRHPYFSEYSLLQKLSLQILRHEKMSHGGSNDKLAGIVFDGAWLWEEYLNKVLASHDDICKLGIVHPRNKEKTGAIHVYHSEKSAGTSPIYPDFLLGPRDCARQEWDVVLDAKYKRMYNEINGGRDISRDDRYQMISYLHVTKARLGVFMCPTKEGIADLTERPEKFLKGELLGYGGEIAVVPFVIPKIGNTFMEFSRRMKAAENDFCLRLLSVLRHHQNNR